MQNTEGRKEQIKSLRSFPGLGQTASLPALGRVLVHQQEQHLVLKENAVLNPCSVVEASRDGPLSFRTLLPVAA